MDDIPFKLGDVLQLQGESVPREYWDHFFVIIGWTPAGEPQLSVPFKAREDATVLALEVLRHIN